MSHCKRSIFKENINTRFSSCFCHCSQSEKNEILFFSNTSETRGEKSYVSSPSESPVNLHLHGDCPHFFLHLPTPVLQLPWKLIGWHLRVQLCCDKLFQVKWKGLCLETKHHLTPLGFSLFMRTHTANRIKQHHMTATHTFGLTDECIQLNGHKSLDPFTPSRPHTHTHNLLGCSLDWMKH